MTNKARDAAPELLEALVRLLAAHDANVAAGSLIATANQQAADQARAAIHLAGVGHERLGIRSHLSVNALGRHLRKD